MLDTTGLISVTVVGLKVQLIPAGVVALIAIGPPNPP